jgi:hypothetical protein
LFHFIYNSFLQLRLSFFKKDASGTFRILFKSNPVDWCKVTANAKRKSTPFQRAMLAALSKHLKSVMRRCPFPVNTYDVNVGSVERKYALMLPEGFYRFDLEVFNNIDATIFAISVVVELEK